MKIRITTSWWVLAAALVAGCDEGDPPSAPAGLIGNPGPTFGTASAPAPAPAAPAPVSLEPRTMFPVVAHGTVTALGSIWVNGVIYDTSRAEFWVDDEPATADEVHVGDVVRVLGRVRCCSNSVADKVTVRRVLHGPIGSVDVARSSLVVLGQTVVVDVGVVFDASIPQRALAGLAVGDVVEISGLPGSNGRIFASRIAKRPLNSRGLKVTGTATNVDRDRLRFTVNGLVVDYRAAAWTSLSPATFVSGNPVEVRGSSLSASGELVATNVALNELPTGSENWGVHMELEGFVTAHDAGELPSYFTLGGIRVEAPKGTKYDGDLASDWLDAKLEVRGTGHSDGSVLASRIRFVQRTPVQIRARVDSVSPATGTFVVLGIRIETQPSTRLTDESAIHAQPFGLPNLAAGDYVYVAGAEVPRGSGLVVASLVERQDPLDEVRLQGYLPLVGPALDYYFSPLSIFGVTVHTGGALFPTPGGGRLNAATFYDDLRPGTFIDVRGVAVTDRTIAAREVRFADWTSTVVKAD